MVTLPQTPAAKRQKVYHRVSVSDVTRDDDKVYREEVLGKRIELLFETGGLNTEFFAGTIRKLLVELQDEESNRTTTKHFILFDDGDKKWIDIAEEERKGELRWIEDSSALTLKLEAEVKCEEREEGPDENQERKQIPLVKQEDSEEDDVKEARGAASLPTRHDKYHSQETQIGIKLEHDQDRAMGKGNNIPSDSDSLGELSAFESDTEESEPDVMPASIDGILRYMDELEPYQNYFERQKDFRNGCSKTRGKLRNFARKNPDHPAVKHWIDTNSWKPPNQKSLRAIISLLKTLIK